MIVTLKALSALLAYPTPDLQAATAEIGAALARERLLPTRDLAAIRPLLEEIRTTDVVDLEEAYVGLFDRSRTLALDLFEHVHGESRARGGAMVDLLETYRAAGFEPRGSQLPDHLPMLLEFLATRPLDEARETLADAAHILEAMRVRLERRESAYAAIFQALVSVARAKPEREAVEALTAMPEDDPEDLEALDEAWEETAVTFGPDPNAGCPATREMLARMDLPRNPAPATAAE